MRASHQEVYKMERLWPGILQPRWLLFAATNPQLNPLPMASSTPPMPLASVDRPQTPTEEDVPGLEYDLDRNAEATPTGSPVTPSFDRSTREQPDFVSAEGMDEETKDAAERQPEDPKKTWSRPVTVFHDLGTPSPHEQSYKMKKMARQCGTEEQLFERTQAFVRGQN